ncbi:MAG: dTDP-4-dehydrorhamnose 3,5-epimerase family protein, partial [Phenylobacterium sp.]|nr:dTDP-4-dehydrorhamnose 3,5-epimerase family protein [Phenylobacterium sp.]
EADTDVHYEIDRFFEPGKGDGVRWNDPAFGIAWPAEPRVMSDRDAAWPDFCPA